MPNMRRGLAPGASGDDAVAARAKGGSIASRNGSDSRMPDPRRKWRRDMARRVVMKGASIDAEETRARDGVFTGSRVWGTDYLVWKRLLCTTSWTSVRTPYCRAAARLR